MTPGGDGIACREGDPAYDVRWAWQDGPLEPGLTCVFRVKDEAHHLRWVLPPVLASVDRVVLVDNGSTDGTLDLAQRIAEEEGAADRFTGLAYPHAVARAGEEHLRTPPDSVRSLVHFYNWSFSHVRTTWSMKWDGDMVLTPEGVRTLRSLAWRLEGTTSVVVVPRHPLVVVDERTAWLDLSSRFLEAWIWPHGPATTFTKGLAWEVRRFPGHAERLELPDATCVELKWLERDEFAHWTADSLAAAELAGEGLAPRKARELAVDRAVRGGTAAELPGLVRVDAPEGVHVVDHVVQEWLPAQRRPLVRRGRRR